jgi:hypothetical protein
LEKIAHALVEKEVLDIDETLALLGMTPKIETPSEKENLSNDVNEVDSPGTPDAQSKNSDPQ